MSDKEILNFHDSMIAIHYEEGQPFIQVKSTGDAINVSLSLLKDEYPDTILVNGKSYGTPSDIIDRLKRVNKKESKAEALSLAEQIEDSFLNRSITPVQGIDKFKVMMSAEVSSDSAERKKERKILLKAKEKLDIKLQILDLTEQLLKD